MQTRGALLPRSLKLKGWSRQGGDEIVMRLQSTGRSTDYESYIQRTAPNVNINWDIMALETFQRASLHHLEISSLIALGGLFEVLGCYCILAHINSTRSFNHTFKMEKNIRLVVLEHLSHQLDVHVLDVDLLDGCQYRAGLVDSMMHTCRLLFMTMMASFSFSYTSSKF